VHVGRTAEYGVLGGDLILTIQGDCLSSIYFELLQRALVNKDNVQQSRNGPVIDLGPAAIEISNRDTFRMPLLEKRYLNPFFALVEFSWFIEGSNLLQPLLYILPHYHIYSDDGITLNGAYGYRLRNEGPDQIEQAIEELRADPSTRRVVLNTYKTKDLISHSKDVPCNTSIMFKVRDDALDMTVINRSNDLFWGVPYNICVFYLLQCYIAKRLERTVGYQRHFIDSLHLYVNKMTRVEEIIAANSFHKIEQMKEAVPQFDISEYLNVNHSQVTTQKFNELGDPLFRQYFMLHDQIKSGEALNPVVGIPPNQLGYAAFLWLQGKKGFGTSEWEKFVG